ncbi:MAG: D-alanyl-D-alanine carboxypeptidase family protein [Clostridia bacterium]
MLKFTKLRKIFLIIIILLFTFNIFYTLSFAESSLPSVYSPSCILMDADSGRILYSKNANAKMYPASTTKIMTAILTLENCKLDDVAVASHNAVYSIPYGYSVATIQEGEELTIEQLLHVLLIPSANDAAVVLAEHIAGSVESFANMMNNKAIELGCKNTHFVNPNGIHNEDHYSTAYDLALIGKYAMQFDTFRSIVKKTSYSLPKTNKYDKEDRLFNTTNELIKKNYSSSPANYYYEYATGAKTGYTDAAKSCIVATATKDNISLIAVVLHSESTDNGLNARPIDCKTLFEYGFNNFSMQTFCLKGTVANQISVKNATKETASLDLLYSDDLSGLVPNGTDLSTITPNIKLTENLSAPIFEGTNVGTITYSIDGSEYSCSLIASHNVYKSNFVKTLLELLLLILFLFIFAKFLHYRNTKQNKRKKSYNKRNNKRNYINNFYPTYKN